MRLRTQIGLATAAALVVIAGAIAAQIAAGQRAESIARTSERTERISLDVARLAPITADKPRDRGEQTAPQWRHPHPEIGVALLVHSGPALAPAMVSARARHAALGKLFDSLAEPGRASATGPAEDPALGRMLTEARALAGDLHRLQTATMAAAASNREQLRWATLATGLLVLGFLVGLALLMHVRVLGPLKKLEGFARQVQSGARDMRVRSVARDELGDLTRALDQMLDALAEESARAQASEERFRRFFEAGLIGMTISSPQGEVVEVNDALCGMLGLPRAALMGRRWEDYTHPEDVAETLRMRNRTVAGEIEAHQMQKRFIRADGGVMHAEVAVRSIRDPDGSLRFLVGLVQDVTERIHAQQALQERTAELERSNRDLEQFAYIASHDLQEPLRMVATFTQLLQERYRGRLDAQADEFIHYAADGATRMQHLIRDLLAFSRIGSGGRELERVDSARALEQAVANLRALREESGASIVAESLPAVLANPTLLVQLFQNLVGNALKFRGSDPPLVRVSARRAGRMWEFAVADNGIGIAPAHHERIFGLFKRLHGRERYPGTGIGLALCRKIVEHHGGAIRVESAPGRGATFYFSAPAADKQGGAETPLPG